MSRLTNFVVISFAVLCNEDDVVCHQKVGHISIILHGTIFQK